jgi:uncharacterized protein (TIGR00369 family)
MPTVLDTYIENRHIIQPNQTNNLDTAHGGVVMSLMDNVGAMSAMRFASEACVTASVDSIDFLQPVPRGAIAVVESWVYDAGRTSIQVRLRVDKENGRTGERQRTTDSCFTFVAVDGSGKPTEVPSLEVETERGEELRRLGLENDG